MRKPNRHCPFCGRKVTVSDTPFAENPYCQKCLAERVKQAASRRGPVSCRRVRGLLVFTPTGGTSS